MRRAAGVVSGGAGAGFYTSTAERAMWVLLGPLPGEHDLLDVAQVIGVGADGVCHAGA